MTKPELCKCGHKEEDHFEDWREDPNTESEYPIYLECDLCDCKYYEEKKEYNVFEDLDYLKNAYKKEFMKEEMLIKLTKEQFEYMDKPFEERIKDWIDYLKKHVKYSDIKKLIKELKKCLKKK